MERQLEISFSKKSVPCLWESGGSWTNTGESQIVAGKDGLPKAALYIRGEGSLACGRHALIPIEVGDYVVQAKHHRKDFRISILQITALDTVKGVATTTEVNSFSEGEWDEPFTMEMGHLVPSCERAKDKASEYHCRRAMYIDDTEY